MIPEWGQLHGLELLNLSHNSLTGQLPPEWAQSFTNLTMLDLSSNLINNHLPAGAGPHIC